MARKNQQVKNQEVETDMETQEIEQAFEEIVQTVNQITATLEETEVQALETQAQEVPTLEVQETPTLVEAQTEEIKVPKQKSAGSIIREIFLSLLDKNLISEDILCELTSAAATKQNLKIRYAFLKEYNSELGIKEQILVNGRPRYTSKPIIELFGKQYLITNDFYKRNIEDFKNWAAKIEESVGTQNV